MAQNLQIDPTTRDYVLDKGSPVPSDRVLEASYYALTIPQGNYLYNTPGQGSLIYTLEGSLRDNGIDQRFNSFATDAIQRQVVSTGQASDVQAFNIGYTRDSTSNEIDVKASQTQISNQLNFISVE